MQKIWEFKDKKLLRRALTHSSYANENPGDVGDNERLEFLGDAILAFVSADYLYQQIGEMAEGEMTWRRSALVDEEQLAKFAIAIGLDSKMLLGQGLARNGGCQNPNLLSSAFEALVGAYYLDNNRDIEAVRMLLEELFASVIHHMTEIGSNIDFKNQFQEWVQANALMTLPRYTTEKVGGTDHAPEFLSKVYVGEKCYGVGKGRSKKEAEKQAAENALTNLKNQGLLLNKG